MKFRLYLADVWFDGEGAPYVNDVLETGVIIEARMDVDAINAALVAEFARDNGANNGADGLPHVDESILFDDEADTVYLSANVGGEEDIPFGELRRL